MSKRFTSIIACAFLVACGGGDGGPSGPGNPALSLHLSADTARAGTMLRITVRGTQLLPDSMPATLGAVPVALARTSDSTASLLLPEINAGNHVLRLQLGPHSAQATVSVLAGQSFANPAASVNALLDAYLAQVPAVAPAGVSTAEWSARRATLDSLVQDTRTQLAAAAPAEQLALARLLTSFGTPSFTTPAQAPSLAIFKASDECTAAARTAFTVGATAALSAAAIYGIAVQPAIAVPFKAIAITAALTVFTASALSLPEVYTGMTSTCWSQESVDVADDDLGFSAFAANRILTAQSPSDKRFHNRIARTLYPRGLFRPLAGTDVADNADVLGASDWLDEIHATVAGLPAWVRNLMPALPQPLSQLPQQPAVQKSVDAAAVRIERVQPTSVTLNVGGSGRTLQITAASGATQNVQFTYDVVSVANPTLRTTKSGTFRPSLAVTMAPQQSTVTGTRTESVDELGNRYGQLTCSFTALQTVTGGDTGGWVEWAESMSWNGGSMQRTNSLRRTDGSYPSFSEGVHPLSPNAYFTRYSVDGQPEYRGFSVSLSGSYVDNLTGATASAGSASFTCQ